MSFTVKDLARESGGLAMLAVDQREALRTMFENVSGIKPTPDSTLTEFKCNAAEILSPYASAILLDRQFCLKQVVERKVLAPNCALLAAYDSFIPGNGIPVDQVVFDEELNIEEAKKMGAKALKLLVLWREDESKDERLAFVQEFVKRCKQAGLVSILEPVVRPPRHLARFDREECILNAAKELGETEVDVYKTEMPLCGKGTFKELVEASKRLNGLIKMPWVILSSGVHPDAYPRSVRAAMEAGASGFLAGRAVWSNVVGATDQRMMLEDLAVPRLKRLGEIVDDYMAKR